MNARGSMSILFSLFCLALPVAQAQTFIELSADEIERLQIEFSVIRQAGQLEGEQFPGTVITSPDDNAAVTARFAGELSEWNVQPGDKVYKGQILAKILGQSVLELQEQWLRSQQALEEANYILSKDQQLFDGGLIAGTRLASSKRAYEEAGYRVSSLSESLRIAGMDEQQLEALKTGQGLGYYSVRASQDGILTHRLVEKGEFVAANTRVASLNSQNLWISAEIPARLSTRIIAGQVLSIRNNNAELVLRNKDQEADPAHQTVGIQAQIMTGTDLMPGQLVSIVIPASTPGLFIPSTAVVHNHDERTVYVKTSQGVEARQLNLTPLGSGYLATSGISINEQLVVKGAAILKGIQLGLGGE